MARELNPVGIGLFDVFGVVGALVGGELAFLALLLAAQTIFVSGSRLGNRVAFLVTWTLLVLVAADALWDAGQVFLAR